jgi:hypothetical protein
VGLDQALQRPTREQWDVAGEQYQRAAFAAEDRRGLKERMPGAQLRFLDDKLNGRPITQVIFDFCRSMADDKSDAGRLELFGRVENAID